VAESSCLLVSCHPLKDSLCHHLVERVETGLKAQGITYEHLESPAIFWSRPTCSWRGIHR